MYDPDRIVFLDFVSDALKGNPLGDPTKRLFPVYLPPGYHQSPARRYPVLWALTGFTGQGFSYLYSRYLHAGLHEVLDGLVLDQGMEPAIVAFPDCITKYGGSQYDNSTATGRYDDYIVKELVPLVDQSFRTNGLRGLFGGSSGGIGAFTLAAKHPDVFHGFADHSGDSGFESCYLNDIPAFVQAIAKYDYSLENFIEAIPTIPDPRTEGFDVLINFVGMASCYGANPDVPLGFEMPFDLYTGEVHWDRWQQWRAHDPVNMVEPYADNLRKLRFRYIDCGTRDQYHLYLGARQLHRKLEAQRIAHIYEEYDSDHFILRRHQETKSIPLLAKSLSE
jgi:enterochelin esterase family protein